MPKIMLSCLLICLDVWAGPQHIIIPRMRETSRMGALYSRELPSRNTNTYESLRSYENSRGGTSYRRSSETEMRNRCFENHERSACDYVRNYL